ncbi:hypothetical protein N0V88_001563 [Collariella sp. IMI 366227]|nr:hypothetical protein N0V88_001563 [Collariella sp. IMI 366227]
MNGINRQRDMIRERIRREGGPGSARFVAQCLWQALVCYLVWDVVFNVGKKADIPKDWEWNAETMKRIALLEVLMLATVYMGMTMQFALAAAVGVGLGLNEPEPCLGISFYIVDKLRIPRRSIFAYFFHLLVAFVISDFFHILGVGTVAGGYYPLKNLIADFSTFFLLQTMVGTVEAFVIGLVSQDLNLSTTTTKADPNSKQQNGPGIPAIDQTKSSVSSQHQKAIRPPAVDGKAILMVTKIKMKSSRP